MKNILYILSALFILSCGQDEPREIIETNTAPSIPSLLSPDNNLLCISSKLNFEWTSSTDDDGDAINYYYEVSTDNMFGNIAKSGTLKETIKNLQLEKETAYYWHVRAIDSKGNKSDFSETWNLYTENIPLENHLPFMPELIAPKMDITLNINTVTLEWDCSDIDNDDLIYNVYFGKSGTPELISSHQSETFIEVNLDSNSDYHWKIEAIDIHNGKTIGQMWDFSTIF
jgi:hypothetical protein